MITARMGSSRLHKKMIRNIGNKSLLIYFIKSLKTIPLIDNIILATTTNEDDNGLCIIAEEMNIKFFRGSENNVLDRIDKAISFNAPNTSIIVRACADNPLIDTKILNKIIEETIESNHLITPFELNSCPFGIGLAVFPKLQLDEIKIQTKKPIYLEHVENYLIENGKFSFFHKFNDYISHYLYLTIDYEEDLQRCNYFMKLFNLTNSKVFKKVEKNIQENVCFLTFEKKWKKFEIFLNQLKIKLLVIDKNKVFKLNTSSLDLSGTILTDNVVIYEKIRNIHKKFYYCNLENLYLDNELKDNFVFCLKEEVRDKNLNLFYKNTHNLKNLAQFIFVLRFFRFGFIRKNLFCDYWSSSSKSDVGKRYGFPDFETVCCPQRVIFDIGKVTYQKYNQISDLISTVSKVIKKIHNKKVIKYKINKGDYLPCIQLAETEIIDKCNIDFFRDLVIKDDAIEDLIFILKSIKYNKNTWVMIWLCFEWQGKKMHENRLEKSKLLA